MARPLDECPNCGATFRRGRLACPECGSDADTGWRSSEDVDYLSIELPDYLPADLDAEEPARPAWRRPLLLILLLILAVTVPLIVSLI